MPQLTTYTVRFVQTTRGGDTVHDEYLFDSPCEAYSVIQNLLERPYLRSYNLRSYKIIKEEVISLDELKNEMRESLEIIKKD